MDVGSKCAFNENHDRGDNDDDDDDDDDDGDDEWLCEFDTV